METLKVKKWGNSNGIRIPKNVMQFLGIHTDDNITIATEVVDGKKRIVIESVGAPKEYTVAELFKDYEGGPFQSEVIDFGEPIGKELW